MCMQNLVGPGATPVHETDLPCMEKLVDFGVDLLVTWWARTQKETGKNRALSDRASQRARAKERFQNLTRPRPSRPLAPLDGHHQIKRLTSRPTKHAIRVLASHWPAY
jgi:hypothetical protein